MEYAYTQTGPEPIVLGASTEEVTPKGQAAAFEAGPELMAPGHLYNPRTGTGIEWSPAGADAGAPGRVRLWSRQWSGQPTVLAEAEHRTRSPWEYWYSLEFANSFPQVTHWWFGDAWTGMVRVWRPEGVGRDPESGAPQVSGWMRFGPPGPLGSSVPPGQADPLDTGETADPDLTAPLPWTVLLSNPLRVNAPLPPMSTNGVNLPLQLLLGATVLEMLAAWADPGSHGDGTYVGDLSYIDVALTSLVRREDMGRAFPTGFGALRLDRLADLTPREALCRVQGLDPAL